VVKTTTSAIELDSFGVIQNTFNTRSAFKLVYILEQANTVGQILNGKKAPVLLNLLKIDQVKLGHFSKIAVPENLENATAIAILVNSGFQKKALNFWYGFKKRTCPIVVFTDKNAANTWLLTHLNNK